MGGGPIGDKPNFGQGLTVATVVVALCGCQLLQFRVILQETLRSALVSVLLTAPSGKASSPAAQILRN